MTFQAKASETFLVIFEENKQQIRNFPGCEYLELWQENGAEAVFMTYSWWKDEQALEAYRHSELFRKTWAKTKVLFAARPEAWSMIVKSNTP